MVLNIWQGSYCIIRNEIHRFIIFHFLKFNKMLNHFFIIIHSSSVFRYTNTRRIIRRVFKQYCPPPNLFVKDILSIHFVPLLFLFAVLFFVILPAPFFFIL